MFITRRSLLRTARLLPVIITVSCHNDDWNGDEGRFYFILIGDDNDDHYKTHTMVELVLFLLISDDASFQFYLAK